MQLYSVLSSSYGTVAGYREYIDTLRVIDTVEPLSLSAALRVARAYFRGQPSHPVRACRWSAAPAHGWDFRVGVYIPSPTEMPVNAVHSPGVESTLVSDVTSPTPTLSPWDLASVYNFCPRIERLLGACGDCPARGTCIEDLVWPVAPSTASLAYVISATGRKSVPVLFFHSSKATLEGYAHVAPVHLPLAHVHPPAPRLELDSYIRANMKRASDVAKEGRATRQRGLAICPSCIFAGPKGTPCHKWQIRQCTRAITEPDLLAGVRSRASADYRLLHSSGFTSAQRHALMRASGAELDAAPGGADLWRRQKRGCLGHFYAGAFRVFSTRADFQRYERYFTWEQLVDGFPEVAALPQRFPEPVSADLEALYALASMYQSRSTGWGKGKGTAELRVLRVTGRHLDGYYANSTYVRNYPTYTLSENPDPEVLWSVYARTQGYQTWDRTELVRV